METHKFFEAEAGVAHHHFLCILLTEASHVA